MSVWVEGTPWVVRVVRGMTAVTIHDLKHPDSPAVVEALTRKCGLCGVAKGEFCHAVGVGKKMVGLVHFARATAGYAEARNEK